MKNFKRVIAVLCVAMLMLVLAACGSSDTESSDAADSTETTEAAEETTPGTARDGNEVDIETASINLVNAVEAGGYELVDTATLKEWVDNGEDMIVIDTMPADSFASNRIPGAVNAEIAMTEEEITDEQRAAFVSALGEDKDAKIVVYCGFVKCPRSHLGAMIAKEEGFTNVVRYPGGIGAWLDAGYDVESDN